MPHEREYDHTGTAGQVTEPIVRRPKPPEPPRPEGYSLPTASYRETISGQGIFKLKTRLGTFSLRPIAGEKETYKVQVTSSDLPGLFKNSGISSFGWFTITRYPGRTAVSRPNTLGPIAGNAVLMWPHLDANERNRCIEHLEKLLRSEIPRIEAEAKPDRAVNERRRF
jgi:hypothetical protein